MLIGSKQLSEMSEAELIAAIDELQHNREALRAEAIARKQKERTTLAEPRAPRPPKKEANTALDVIMANLLKEME